MKILYGPPGTGKTWRAAREAVKTIEPDLYRTALGTDDPDIDLRKLHNSLVADGRIIWVTFHPSYSYEDFMEGYRPVVDDTGQLAYRVVDGPFKVLCQRTRFDDDLQIGEQLTDASGRPAGVVVDKDGNGWVIRVKPNRADEVATSIDKYVSRYVVSRILDGGFVPQIFSIPGSSVVELADYGIDPSDADVPPPKETETSTTRIGSTIRKIIAARTGIFSSSDLSNASHIGSVVRRLAEIRQQQPEAASSVVLVIDEINRAEPSRVFGELLTLLESDKRKGMPEEKRIILPYSKTLFTVPQSVSIIGTMNTVDRSLTALDFAMRRRFEFELITADPSLIPEVYAGVDIRALLRRINSRLHLLLGTGYEFGHSFFMKERLGSIRQAQDWQDNDDGNLRTLAHVLRTSIFPTLAEYVHDDWIKMRAIAGQTRVAGEVESLFNQPAKDPQFVARLPDEYELSEGRPGDYASWWDPLADAWRGDQFKAFIAALAAGE
jgi:5-methylcytosine-specific restriction protein B